LVVSLFLLDRSTLCFGTAISLVLAALGAADGAHWADARLAAGMGLAILLLTRP
jgi:hypothetical protein